MVSRHHLPDTLREELSCVKDCHVNDARIKADAIDRQLARVGLNTLAMVERGQVGEGRPPPERRRKSRLGNPEMRDAPAARGDNNHIEDTSMLV
jgi:hypothetical protein